MAKRIKTGGRVQGTPNQVTKELRDLITSFLENNWKTVEQDFNNLDPKDRCKLYINLLQYCIPKPQTINMNILEEQEPINIIITKASEIHGKKN